MTTSELLLAKLCAPGLPLGGAQLYDRLDRGRERAQPEWRFGPLSGMIETAENLAEKFSVTREDADAFSARSHQRAAAAWDAGYFTDEVVAVAVPQRKGDSVLIDRDELITSDSTVRASRLTAITAKLVAAGNSEPAGDAASAASHWQRNKLDELRLEPLGFLIRGWPLDGIQPPWD